MSLKPIKSDILRHVRHGFFTRVGGVSTGIYNSLNCGKGSNDQLNHVLDNRDKVASHYGNSSTLVSVQQIHSDIVAHIENPWEDNPPKADAIVTNKTDIVLGILTADCAPVLFYDGKNKVIGAAHSGWKGAISGVIGNTISEMIKLGAELNEIHAVIGPCISQRNYEVGPDFFDKFRSHDPSYTRFFASGSGDHMQFDLPSFVLHQLRDAGVEQCEWTGHCTYEDTDKFFSYRRSTHQNAPDYGRQIATITL